jgi:tetratricopeptide (TPR) repeat protein
MYALANLCHSAAEIGNTDEALDHLDQLSTMAREARISTVILRSMHYSAFLAVHIGDVERAESEVLEALEYAKQHTAERGMGGYGGVIYNVRRAQGRSAELIPLLEGLVESEPTLPVWRIALAGAYYFAERTDELRAHVAWLSADRCSRVPKNVTYPVTLCGMGRLAPYADLDAESCEFIYVTLAPFAGIMKFTGASISDAIDVALACLADHLGRHDIADDHYRDAIALTDRARAIPFSTHYRFEWARALADRGDTDRARPLLIEVATIAKGRGMDGPDGYVAWSAKLLDRIS